MVCTSTSSDCSTTKVRIPSEYSKHCTAPACTRATVPVGLLAADVVELHIKFTP